MSATQRVKLVPTPFSIWEVLREGLDLKKARLAVDWQYEGDFDQLVKLFKEQALEVARELYLWNEATKSLSQKELGNMLLGLDNEHKIIKRLLFPFRATKGDIFKGKSRKRLFDFLKPANNTILGYEPSAAMKRLIAEITIAA